MIRKLPNALWVLALAFPAAISAAAPKKASLDAVFDSLLALSEIREVAISPDGQRVAWVETRRNTEGTPSSEPGIYVADLSGASTSPRRITAGGEGGSYLHIAWAQDSRELAFLSDAQSPRQYQVYIASADGGPARKLTSLTGSLATPRWSPDGKTLAVLFIENTPRKPGPMEPMLPASGVIGGNIYHQRLTTLDVASGRVRRVSPADLNIYEYDWSADGKKFAMIASHGEPDNNWYLAEVYTLDIASSEAESIYKPDLQIAHPRWSPDGKSVAFIGGLMSDEHAKGGDIYLIPAGGGAAHNLTDKMKGSASSFVWRGGDEILFLENLDGSSAIATLGGFERPDHFALEWRRDPLRPSYWRYTESRSFPLERWKSLCCHP